MFGFGEYWFEFSAIMIAFTIGAVAPGPDFAVVLRQSIVRGRQSAMVTSAGIASAILIHGAYTVLGLGLLAGQSLLAFSVIKFVGVAYLLWLGISAWRAPAPDAAKLESEAQNADAERGLMRAFGLGFLTNLLNPKAVVFFVALFSSLVSPQTPIGVQAFYIFCMSLILASWFTFVSFIFTTQKVREKFYAMGKWFNRATGSILVLLALSVATTQSK